nr:uncharacterized protein LOC109158503 [Ipomoea trifida]
MSNTKTLSNQRSAEDLDLLERSTKKSKQDAGDPVVSEMEIVAETPLSSGDGIEDMVSVEEEAVSLGEDRSAMDPNGVVPDQVEVVPETPLVVGNGQPPERISGDPVIPSGGAPARSYLDTESCPTRPKEAETEVPDPIPDGEVSVRRNDQNRSGEKHDGSTGGRPFVMGAHPYGPWMIATRRERRQQGRPLGQGRPAEGVAQRPTSGRQMENNIGNGSRFALLDNDEGIDCHDNSGDKDTTGSQHTEARPAGLGGKQKRANVIVNEKQIQNEVQSSRSASETEKEASRGRRSAGGSSRRAAEEDEHVVIRGTQGGQITTTEVVQSGNNVAADAPAAPQTSPEHHGDPPEDFDAEGDVIMEVEVHQQAVVDDGGCASPSV